MSASHTDDLSKKDHLRSALVQVQGVAVSDTDAGRIAKVTNGIAAALAMAAGRSLFDTEPAHFDRYQIALVGQDSSTVQAPS